MKRNRGLKPTIIFTSVLLPERFGRAWGSPCTFGTHLRDSPEFSPLPVPQGPGSFNECVWVHYCTPIVTNTLNREIFLCLLRNVGECEAASLKRFAAGASGAPTRCGVGSRPQRVSWARQPATARIAPAYTVRLPSPSFSQGKGRCCRKPMI